MNKEKEEGFSKMSINWDSGAYRKLLVIIDISDFYQKTSCII